MSSLIPVDPTPAQRRVLESEWFQEALTEATSIEVAELPFHDISLWSRTPSSATFNAFATSSASTLSLVLALTQHWIDAVASSSDDPVASWGKILRAASRMCIPFYEPVCLEVLDELMFASVMLCPHPKRFQSTSHGLIDPSAAPDRNFLWYHLARASDEIEAGSKQAVEVRARIVRALQVDASLRPKLRAAIKTHRKRFPYFVGIDPIFLQFSQLEPLELLIAGFMSFWRPELTDPFDQAATIGTERKEQEESAALLWQLSVNALQLHPAYLGVARKMSELLGFLISLSPVRFTRKQVPVHLHERQELLADAEALARCTALLVQSGQLTILHQLFFSTLRAHDWSRLLTLLISRNVSIAHAGLLVWVFGTKKQQTDSLAARLKDHISREELLQVLLDALDMKVTSTRLDAIVSILEQCAPSFDATQQQALADAAARTLRGKALKSLLRFTPDAEPVASVKKKTSSPTTSDKNLKKEKSMSTKKTNDPVHPVLDGIKGKKLPKQIDATLGEDLVWSDEKRPVSPAEFATLITVLRESGPYEAHHPRVDAIVEKLEPKALSALGFALLETWEGADSPAKDKWMLFQLRHTGEKKRVTKLGKAHNWESWASSGKWARAQWYLDVVGAMGPSKANDKLFIGLLDAGHVNSTLQMAAREIFPRFSKSLGYDNVQKYFMERGLLGHVPKPGPLPFEPGKSTIELGEEAYVLLVEQAQLRLQRQSDHHKMNLTDEMLAANKTLQRHADAVFKHSIQWGAFYERMHRLGESLGVAAARKSLRSQGPVHQDIFCSLLWRVDGADNAKVFRFDPEGTCFDVAYEQVEIPEKGKLQIVSISSLEGAEKKEWLEHLTESEVILPFDLLDASYYVKRLEELMKAPFDTSSRAYSDVVWALAEQGYRKGSVEDNGIVWTHYKTLPDYNLRVFFHHTGVDVSRDSTLESPGELKGVDFTDLLGAAVPMKQVEPGALSIICDDLATFLISPF